MVTDKIKQKKNPFGDVFPINSLPAARLVDAGIDRIVADADIKFEACQRYYDKVDADILFFFSDVAIQAEAMGARVSMSADAMPCIAAPAQIIQTPNPSEFGRMRVNAQVTRRLKACFPQKSVSTLVYGPFTVAGQIMGEQILLRKIIQDSCEVRKILEKTFQIAKAYADYLLDAGADIFWISDPLAALLPPDRFWEFAGEYLARLFHLYVETPSIVHICGDTGEILSQVLKTGAWGISLDQCMDLMSIEDEIPPDMFIIGNLDPAEKMEQATPEEISVSVMDLANLMGAKPNYIMSTGCALPPATSLENVQIFVNTARQALNTLKPNAAIINSLRGSVFEGNCDHTRQWAEKAVKNNVPVLTVIDAGLMRSVRKGTILYEAKKIFLPDILLMADAFYAGYAHLKPFIPQTRDCKVDVVIGTVKGDFHEIGKDLVRIFLEINGFNVVDLGVDVPPEDFVRAFQTTHAKVIGLSAFLTSDRKQLTTVIDMFGKENGKKNIVVGGAAVNQSIADRIGANGYAKNAVEAVSVIKNLLTKTRVV